MLRKTIYAVLIANLTMEAASAQDQEGARRIESMPGYSPMRTQQERKKDTEIDSAYKSTIKALSDTEKKKSDPWGDVRSAPAPETKNKQ